MNAKLELLEFLKYKPDVKCAIISPYSGMNVLLEEDFLLKEEYSIEDFETFINSLPHEYGNGKKPYFLFGTIWFVNGAWATRTERFGIYEWEYRTVPQIPKDLKNENRN